MIDHQDAPAATRPENPTAPDGGPFTKNGILATSSEGAQDRPREAGPVALYLESLAPGSRRSQASAVEIIEIAFAKRTGRPRIDWGGMRYQDVAAIRADLVRRYAPATAKRMMSAVRGVLRMAWRLGLMTREQLERALDLPPVCGENLPPGRPLTVDELVALFDDCRAERTPVSIRDAAALALLFGAGLRRRELVGLDVGDVNLDTATVAVRMGKGRRERRVPLQPGAVAAVQEWLEVRGWKPGPLFYATGPGRTVTDRRLSPSGVYNALERRAKRAGVALFSPHDLRRTYVTRLLEEGVDLATVQRLAGHCRQETTARYDRRGEECARAAARRLEVPYRPNGAPDPGAPGG